MCRKAWVLLAAIGVAVLSRSAGATELPNKAPAAVPAYDWSGLYVGANLGYGGSRANWTNLRSSPAATFYDALPGDSFSNRLSGIFGGAQIGYNVQNGRWVYGIEAMLDASAINGDHASTFGAADDQFKANIKALAMVSGRLGYVWDNVLAYGKAGVAVANIRASVSDNVPPTTGAGSDNKWLAGPSVGLGVEYGITPRLSLAVEYDYMRLDSASYQLGGGVGSYLWNLDMRNISIVMAKLNYRINWPR